MITVDKSQKELYLKKIASIENLYTGLNMLECIKKARILIAQLEATGLIKFKDLD